MSDLQVIKKDGSLEAYQSSKVNNSVKLAGATPEQAESITAQVGQWALSSAKEGKISTQEIRGKVIELLKQVNNDAAMNYESFVKKPVQQ